MADCIIETPVSSPEHTLNAARKALEAYGGTLTGDLESGELVAKTPVGELVGNYTVTGELLTIRIVKNPRLAPTAVVRSVVANFFAGLER